MSNGNPYELIIILVFSHTIWPDSPLPGSGGGQKLARAGKFLGKGLTDPVINLKN